MHMQVKKGKHWAIAFFRLKKYAKFLYKFNYVKSHLDSCLPSHKLSELYIKFLNALAFVTFKVMRIEKEKVDPLLNRLKLREIVENIQKNSIEIKSAVNLDNPTMENDEIKIVAKVLAPYEKLLTLYDCDALYKKYYDMHSSDEEETDEEVNSISDSIVDLLAKMTINENNSNTSSNRELSHHMNRSTSALSRSQSISKSLNSRTLPVIRDRVS
jgi:hypothetical protein